MATNKNLLIKSLRFFALTLILMFLAPTVVYQAFKNREHFMYYPVLTVGLILALIAVSLGFYSVKVMLDSLFGKSAK